MRHSLLMLILLVAAVPTALLTACAHRAHVNPDYELVQSETYMIDSGSPPCALYFKGHKVWRSVLYGSPDTCRDGIFVFMSVVPDSLGEDCDYPQMFGIRGAGPPVLFSERILNRPFKAGNREEAGTTYEVEDIRLIPNGMRLTYHVGVTTNGSDIFVTNKVSWPQIETWMQEAQTSARLEKAPLGNYRVLPMKPPNTSTNSVLKPKPTPTP